jgi:hypothetical protein
MSAFAVKTNKTQAQAQTQTRTQTQSHDDDSIFSEFASDATQNPKLNGCDLPPPPQAKPNPIRIEKYVTFHCHPLL